jgi:hypothetical protein
MRGVGLAQYAGVVAALDDGFALEEVLAREGLSPEEWPDVARLWRTTLAQEPFLLFRYLELRHEAEDCLARRIDPLDDEPSAWAGLLATLAMEGPSKVAERLGLTVNDIARLGRAWRRKAERDRGVANALNDLAGKVVEPPPVRAEPLVLCPFPWSPSTTPTTGAAVGESPRGAAALAVARDGRLPLEDDVDLYAAFSAIMDLAPAFRRDALELCGVDDRRLSAITEKWRLRAQAEPDLRAELLVRTSDHRAALRQILAGARPLRVD